MSVGKYYNFYYMLTGKNSKGIRIYSLKTLITIGLSIGLTPDYIYHELKEIGYNVTLSNIKAVSYEHIPMDTWISWMQAMEKGVVRSLYGLEEITKVMKLPIGLANLEWHARQKHKQHTFDKPIDDTWIQDQSLSLSMALQNTSKSMSCISVPDREHS